MLNGIKIPLLIVALAIGITSFFFGNFKIEPGTVDFFQNHNFFFLIFISFFPRLTLLFSSVPFGGILWWLGFFFMPRLLVAILATVAYGQTNPLLVGIAWFVALTGEVLEKKKLSGSRSFIVRRYPGGNPFQRQPEGPGTTTIDKGGVIEAEFTKKD